MRALARPKWQRALQEALGRELIRLQCYEGLTYRAAYEWNAASVARGACPRRRCRTIYGPQYLIKRPLLRALESMTAASPVLLIDELDRADEPFEAYLLEVLSDFQLTIPNSVQCGRPHRPSW